MRYWLKRYPEWKARHKRCRILKKHWSARPACVHYNHRVIPSVRLSVHPPLALLTVGEQMLLTLEPYGLFWSIFAYVCMSTLSTTDMRMDVSTLSISPASHGQLVRMLITLEPHNKYGSSFANMHLFILPLSSHWYAQRWRGCWDNLKRRKLPKITQFYVNLNYTQIEVINYNNSLKTIHPIFAFHTFKINPWHLELEALKHIHIMKKKNKNTISKTIIYLFIGYFITKLDRKQSNTIQIRTENHTHSWAK